MRSVKEEVIHPSSHVGSKFERAAALAQFGHDMRFIFIYRLACLDPMLTDFSTGIYGPGYDERRKHRLKEAYGIDVPEPIYKSS